MYSNLEVELINKSKKNTRFFCKICSYPLMSQKDFSCNEEYNCCSECYLTFVQSRTKEWHEGFVIDKESLSKYLKIRKKINEKIININGDKNGIKF